MVNNKIALCFAGVLIATSANSTVVDLTLSSNKNPIAVSQGENITYIVGISPISSITGYTLDISYDRNELEFITATQLVPFFNGTIIPFNLDPGTFGSNNLATSDHGRASVLQTSNSDPVQDLFSLEFEVLNPVFDAFEDLQIGILDIRANDINPPIGEVPFTFNKSIVSSSVGAVPIPAAFPLMISALLGLVSFKKMQQSL